MDCLMLPLGLAGSSEDLSFATAGAAHAPRMLTPAVCKIDRRLKSVLFLMEMSPWFPGSYHEKWSAVNHRAKKSPGSFRSPPIGECPPLPPPACRQGPRRRSADTSSSQNMSWCES